MSATTIAVAASANGSVAGLFNAAIATAASTANVHGATVNVRDASVRAAPRASANGARASGLRRRLMRASQLVLEPPPLLIRAGSKRWKNISAMLSAAGGISIDM